ncbi:DUF1294 domain-containing protein [Curvibacter sp. APW13]|uniref:DUF1294 domain-containing protein n=1 Tax=Curvibacter sp. APW13 TaxID=3077236 RepID=UPI0028E05116|nr:DUF1294 domain-containing protein [Curvibacter sp. APW13]MDT8992796.1 DUF1294 domain-containing protein [Curvibacter sp. APW13]
MSALAWWYLVVNVVVALVLIADKAAARAGTRRVPEKTLHLLALAGGWPASALVQRLVRHKTRKRGFQVVFWLCATVHCAAVYSAYLWLHPKA